MLRILIVCIFALQWMITGAVDAGNGQQVAAPAQQVETPQQQVATEDNKDEAAAAPEGDKKEEADAADKAQEEKKDEPKEEKNAEDAKKGDDAAAKPTAPGDWCYPANSKNWGGKCNSGANQSPIDLPPFQTAQPQYRLADYMQYRSVLMAGNTRGKFLKWTPTSGQSAVGHFTHDSVRYNFESVEVHAGSEHTVVGKQYDMELEFIHRSDGGEYVGISVLCSVMPLTKPNPIFGNLHTATTEGKMVDLQSFFEELETSQYFLYGGSLTSPPCDGDVTWLVLATVCSVPESFYHFATSLPGMKDTYRPPQDKGDRQVTTKATHLQEHWHYPADNSIWGGICASGRQQSPIDLPVTILSSIAKKSQILDRMHYNPVDFDGIDTDHGLKFKSDGSMGSLALNNEHYDLLQFHIHTQSEHTIAGDQYDLEVHFVHQARKSKTFAIVSVLCTGENFGTSKFFSKLEASMQNSVSIDVKADFLSKLDTTRYFTYQGSLTTPPCTEGVEWVIIAAQCRVPKDYLISLKKYKSMKDNFRPTQNIGDRSIETVSLEAALGDDDLESNQAIDLAEIPLAGKIGFGSGILLFCGIILFRCFRKDPMSQALLHDVDEV